MDPKRFERIETLFHRLLDLDDGARQEILKREDDTEVRDRVLALLGSEAHASTQIDQWIAEEASHCLEHETAVNSPPSSLGPYKILDELGQGGFATVYLAERDDGAFSLRVAIKVVRAGLSRPEIQIRFHQERQILARLQHPNIARILDGGTTPDGVPFVVMELIDGDPVDAYCRQADLDLHARLELFEQICDAVQFAHRNLILHRDIKPTNILVGTDGVPKLLDFGIAKILAPDAEGVPIELPGNPGADPEAATPAKAASIPLTRLGVRVLTPEFASPEQFRGEPLNTSTDVYSLGLLLYLLITDQPAYRLESPRWNDMEQVVCHQVPTPPSEIGKTRTNRWWRPIFEDDLDLIVIRAVHKIPRERYATAGDLAEDLRRYRNGLPIAARRESFTYRARRFILRHRTALAITLLVAMALIGTTLAATIQSGVAERQRQRSDQAVRFLVRMLESSNPYEGWTPETTTREVVEEGARQIRWELRDDPQLRGEMLIILGQVFRSLADYNQSERYLKDGLELLQSLPGDQDVNVVTALRELGQLYLWTGRCKPAREHLQHSRDLAIEALGRRNAELALSLHQLGSAFLRCGDSEEGEQLLAQALELRRAIFGEPSEEVVETRAEIARAQLERGAYDQAENGFSQALEELKVLLPDHHPEFATLLSDLAVVQEQRGRPDSAVELYQQALKIQHRSLGERHGAIALTLHNLGHAEMTRGDWQASEDALNAAYEMLSQIYSSDHPLTAKVLFSLGQLRRSTGDWDGAVELLDQSLAMRIRVHGEDHDLVGQSRFALARIVARDDPDRAEDLYRQVLEHYERVLPENDYRLSHPLYRWGILNFDRGRFADAERLLRRAWELRRQGLPEDSWETAIAAAWLGRCRGKMGHRDEALQILEASRKKLQEVRGADHPLVRDVDYFLGELSKDF